MKGRGILCSKCRRHFTNYVKKNPYEKILNSAEELYKYTINLHNDVNAEIIKKTLHLKKRTSCIRNQFVLMYILGWYVNQLICFFKKIDYIYSLI